MDENDLRERLAEYAHDAWSGWMAYMFSRGSMMTMSVEDEEIQVWVMPPQSYARWQRQMRTPFESLPETEKASDRDEAMKMLAIINQIEDDDERRPDYH